MQAAETKTRSALATGTLLVALTTACAPDETDIRAVGHLDYGGRVERIETLGRYSSLEATLLLQLADAPGKVSTENDYFLYRVTYPTTGVDGGKTTVSGLVALPTTPHIKGVVSWQHGTNTYRPGSISKPSMPEGLGISALFAGDGYLLVAADYIGLGVSTEAQAYYHWPSTVNAVTDLLSIASIMLDGIGESPDGDLYLTGFSQGGGATAAVQRALEEHNPTGLRLRAAAPIAGAFDPRGTSLPHLVESDDTHHFAFLLASFSQVYGQSLTGIVQPDFVDQLAEWFDGTHDQAFLDEHLPDHLEELLTKRFLSDYEAGLEEPAWFYEALEAASTYDYAPQAPLRIHFGRRDTIVIPEEAEHAFLHMQSLGGNVTLVDVGPYGHDDTVLHALPPIQRWFDELEGTAP